MPRVPLIDVDSLPEPAHERVAKHPIDLFKTLANAPGGFLNFADMGDWVRFDAIVEPRVREMVILAVGVVNHSEYEFSHHVKIGRDFGLTDRDIRGVLAAMRDQPNDLDEQDLLHLRAAREITAYGEIADGTWAELEAIHPTQVLVELVLIIAHYSSVTRVLETLRIEVEPEYRRYLEEFPLLER